MKINLRRRKLVIALAEVLASRPLLLAGASLGLSACGGGGGGDTNGTGATSSPPNPVISSISSSSPTALSAVTIKTTGLDTTKAFVVTLSGQGQTGSVTLTPIRTQSDGTIVVAMPLHIDASTGNTSNLAATLTVNQNSLTSAPISLTVMDLPQLSDYGIALGAASRAFYVHQQLALGGNLNAQQAIARLPASKVDSTALRSRLAVQLRNCIMARNDVDRIVTNQNVVINVGTSPDGTAVTYSKQSLEIQDRVVANYLSKSANTGGATQSAQSEEQIAHISSTALSGILQGISTASGWATFKTGQQTIASTQSSTLDDLLAGATVVQTVVTVGAGLVAIGAAVAGAPVIAAGAAAVATYGTIAGVLVGTASITNDLYNVGSSVWKAASASGNDTQANNDAIKAASALAADTVGTLLQIEGIGGVAGSLKSTVGATAESVLQSLFATEATDVALGASQLMATTGNLIIQNALATDAGTTANTVGELSVPSQASNVGVGTVAGTVNIANAEGPVLSGLTGVEISDGTQANTFMSMADAAGNYDVLVPLGVPGVNYSAFSISAFDPISGLVMSSAPVTLTGLTPGQTVGATPLAGVCSDTDAASPDADDPDCD